MNELMLLTQNALAPGVGPVLVEDTYYRLGVKLSAVAPEESVTAQTCVVPLREERLGARDEVFVPVSADGVSNPGIVHVSDRVAEPHPQAVAALRDMLGYMGGSFAYVPYKEYEGVQGVGVTTQKQHNIAVTHEGQLLRFPRVPTQTLAIAGLRAAIMLPAWPRTRVARF